MTFQLLVVGSVFGALHWSVSGAVLGLPPGSLRRSNTDSSLALALRSLWQGVDYRNESFSFRFLAPEPAGGQPPEKQVQVFGLQHTGTNLLSAILYLNFGAQFRYMNLEAEKEVGASEQLQGVLDFAPPPSSMKHVSVLWKHANIKEAFAADPEGVKSIGNNVSAIMMVRDPLSWLQLVHNSPFELKSCMTGEDWLSRPCEISNPGGVGGSKQYNNPIALWNQWNDGYFNADGFGFSHRRVVRYEDLVGNPEAVMDSLAKFLGMEKPVGGWRFPAETPDGENTARVTAFENIHDRTYGGLFTISEQRKVCTLMNQDLKETYGYTKICEEIMQGTP